jgi:polyisoprenoid-binding protein YceI
MDKGLDISQSRVEVLSPHGSLSVSAPLMLLSGRVDYDESNPAEAHLALALASVIPDTGPEGFSAVSQKARPLETVDFPGARFTSTSVVPGPAGQLDVIGTLTINSRSRKIRIPLFAGPAVGGEIFDGSFEISRSDFGIGENRWNSLVEDRVRVRFHLFQTAGA